MTIKIKHKRSAVKGKAPLPADLEYGEIAVNYEATDPALYVKDSADAVRKIGTQPAATETAAGIVELATAAETTTGTDATRAVHPAGLKVELDKKATKTVTSDTAPVNPADGDLWYDSVSGELYVWYDSDDAGAVAGTWVQANPQPTPKQATAAAAGVVQLADAAAISAGTAGRVVDAAAVRQLTGMRNILINGDLKINQRNVTIAAAANGSYGPDRWKKVDAGNMTQIVEEGNYTPAAKHTLSWKGGTPQVLTAPASGHWTMPSIPISAVEVQLELGEVVTPFERRSHGQELALCQRYFCRDASTSWTCAPDTLIATARFVNISYPVTMRAAPTVTYTRSGGTAQYSLNSYSSHASIGIQVATTNDSVSIIEINSAIEL